MKDLIVRRLATLIEFKEDEQGNPIDPPPRKQPLPELVVHPTYSDERIYRTAGGDWHIRQNHGHPDGNWSFTHEDYDGPGDGRYGVDHSIEDCVRRIDSDFGETHFGDYFD